jgi:hypothetical protein
LKYKSLCALCAFSAGFALNNLDKEIRAKAVKDFFFNADDPEDAPRTLGELVFYQCKK